MKKMLTGLITAALVLACATVSASAHHGRAVSQICGGLQSGHMRPACVGQWGGHGHYCVDEDHDGICDNYDPEYCPGNGIADGGSVDADSSGVSSNWGVQSHHNGGHWGRHNGRHCS